MTDENKNTIKINGKAIAVIVILLLLLVGTFGMFILGSSDSNMGSVAQAGGASGDMPEKCRLPAGQDVDSWKEHLGHHSETQDCLKYFN